MSSAEVIWGPNTWKSSDNNGPRKTISRAKKDKRENIGGSRISIRAYNIFAPQSSMSGIIILIKQIAYGPSLRKNNINHNVFRPLCFWKELQIYALNIKTDGGRIWYLANIGSQKADNLEGNI